MLFSQILAHPGVKRRAVSPNQARILIDTLNLVRKVSHNPTWENVRRLGDTLRKNGRQAFGVRKCLLHLKDSPDYHIYLPNLPACEHCPFFKKKHCCPTHMRKKFFPYKDRPAQMVLDLIEVGAILQLHLK